MFILGLLIGCVIGASVGLLVACLLASGHEADAVIEQEYRKIIEGRQL